MLLSCKITNAVLTFLEKEGIDISSLLDGTALPEEFLRDPSYWMQAAEVEKFLNQVQLVTQNYSASNGYNNIFQKVGHSGPELRVWGVLDSVLRMMPRPQEILAQPERFLSYFISPTPPIDHLQRTEQGVEFDLAVSADQYPLVTHYLAASFESLPTYAGQNPATCRWSGIRIEIQWGQEQNSLFGEVDEGRQISPELIRNILSTLEKHSQALEEKNRELQEKNEALVRSQKQLQETIRTRLVLQESTDQFPVVAVEPQLEFNSAKKLDQEIARISDYMVRAQQLITLLVAQGRMNPQVKEAMRRVDWEKVQTQFPKTIEECRKMTRQKGELNV